MIVAPFSPEVLEADSHAPRAPSVFLLKHSAALLRASVEHWRALTALAPSGTGAPS
jgi:hypothetical protein